MELEALYATEIVKEALTRLFNRDVSHFIFLDLGDGSDDDEAWENNMDPLTFARYYARPSNPQFVKIVQDHDRETCTRFEDKMKVWAEGVISADSELSMGKMASPRGESTTFAIRGDKHSPNLLNRRAPFSIRPSTHPNYSERELRRTCGICLTTHGLASQYG